MRLTNYIRDAFIDSVMNDVPKVNFTEKAHKIYVEDILKQIPKEVRAIWDNPQTSRWINDRTVHICGNSVRIPRFGYDDLNLTEKGQAAVKAVEAEYLAQKSSRADLRTRLKGVAYSCTTLKALKEALPEFEKYMPADVEAPSRMVPVIANVVADFVKAGWPKGGSNVAAAR